MTGCVDSNGRALIPITLEHPTSARSATLEIWIDTGFTGQVMISKTALATLNLPIAQKGVAILADGSTVSIQSYQGRLHWFGQDVDVEVIAADGSESLLGVGLLLGHQLHINYVNNTLTLT